VTGNIYVGVGGWTFEPWRGTFFPEGLAQAKELAYAASKLTSIEVNGTYYGTLRPTSFQKWAAETPDDFVFSLKASRFCTNRRVLAEGKESIERFVNSGIHELGDKLGPINWQFMATKKFDPEDFGAFLKLLPEEVGGRKLRHAIEVRSPTFADEQFYDLCRAKGAAIIVAEDETFPKIEQQTADFTYARLMSSREDLETGVEPAAVKSWAKQAKTWAKHGDAFVYFISGAKVRNPAAAQALIAELK
jgi:uncharacterized protein YecE (DUF72 family)